MTEICVGFVDFGFLHASGAAALRKGAGMLVWKQQRLSRSCVS